MKYILLIGAIISIGAIILFSCRGGTQIHFQNVSPAFVPNKDLVFKAGEEFEFKVDTLTNSTPIWRTDYENINVPSTVKFRLNNEVASEERDLWVSGKIDKAGNYDFIIRATTFGTSKRGDRGELKLRITIE